MVGRAVTWAQRHQRRSEGYPAQRARFRGALERGPTNCRPIFPPVEERQFLQTSLGPRVRAGRGARSAFHDLRHTFATWLNRAGVDYVIIEKLLGHRLPGAGDLYLHDWDVRLRDAVTRLERFTRTLLTEENGSEVAARGSRVAVGKGAGSVSSRKMVPRDRIELSTPAFSGLCSTN